MRGSLLLFLCLFASASANAELVVCSDILSKNVCNNKAGCHAVEFTSGFYCATDCTNVSPEDCTNYGGCRLVENAFGSGCEPIDAGQYTVLIGDHFEVRNCPEEYPHSKPGTDSIGFCYKACDGGDADNEDCGFYYESDILACLKENTETLVPTDDYHPENGYSCYLNNRPCSKFNTTISSSNNIKPNYNGEPDPNSTQGEAIWDDSHYDINNCRYVFESHDDTMHCSVKVSFANYDSSVQTAGDTITYTQVSNFSFYHCKSCDTGYTPSATSLGSGYMSCQNTENNKACQCTQSPAGYYTTCTWNSLQALDACGPATCPVGKTSPVGSSNSNACHYSDATQFCDNGGCFNLGSITDLTPADWHQE